MWTSQIKQTDVKCFDDYYKDNVGIWTDPGPDTLERVRQAMSLIGEYKDLSILDLGGGALLGRELQHAKEYTVVDYSLIGCSLAKRIAPHANVINADALDYICTTKKTYDLVIALGLLEYCPKHGLECLFNYCPSDALILYIPVVQGYIFHAPRTVIYSRNEIEEVRKKHLWKLAKDIPQNEHVYTRYERVKE